MPQPSAWMMTSHRGKTRVRYRVPSIESGRSGIEAGFCPRSPFTIASYSSPPYEMCDSPDQSAHYHTVCSKLTTSFQT
jgi:hypothetical protein